jgi:phage tail-like protein
VGIGGIGPDARQFGSVGNLAIAGRQSSQLLYIVDTGYKRVQVLHLATLALLHVFALSDWQPLDVASWGHWAYILDGKDQCVYRHHIGGEQLELACETTFPANWQRITLDREGRIYLLNLHDPENIQLDVFTPGQKRFAYDTSIPGSWEHVRDTGDVSGRFDLPKVILQSDPRPDSPYHRGIFSLEVQPCEADGAETQATDTLWFDRDGTPIEFLPDQFVEPRVYHSDGEWVSSALDSRIYRSQWHRVELLMSAFPPGTRLLFSTYADDNPGLPIGVNWQKSYEVVGISAGAVDKPVDFLIQSRPGQYLWLKIEFFGEGYGTPKIDGMRVHFPRQSYLAHLPAVYSEENGRWFLERFLSIFQTDWDELEARINRFAGLFDPAAVSEQNGSLQNLASRLALPLEAEWDEEQKRHLLQAVASYYPRRGTPDGLRMFVQVYLQNMTSLSPELLPGFPVLIEGFRRRRVESFLLQGMTEDADQEGGPASGAIRLSGAQSVRQSLWGPGKVGRLQLNRYSRAGEARLISTGNPQLELFHEHAYRFEVFVPSAWICTADDERRLRRALDAEKPAQTAYELYLVEPRFRVGIQSTIGVDTIVGAIPTTHLAALGADANKTIPPSQAPRGRLGYDTVLASQPGAPPTLPIQVAGNLQLP